MEELLRRREAEDRTRMLVLTGVLAAMGCAGTMVLRVPSPTGGYVNLGDAVVLMGAYLLGPVWGAAAGALGPALADLLRDAVNRQVLTEDDLYRTEPFVIQKLEADPASARRWRRFRRFCRVERSADRPENGLWFRIPAKLRYIDPLVAGLGRVSRLDAGVRQAQEAFLATDFACWIGVPEETAGEND